MGQCTANRSASFSNAKLSGGGPGGGGVLVAETAPVQQQGVSLAIDQHPATAASAWHSA
jgi:mevalonate kinase